MNITILFVISRLQCGAVNVRSVWPRIRTVSNQWPMSYLNSGDTQRLSLQNSLRPISFEVWTFRFLRPGALWNLENSASEGRGGALWGSARHAQQTIMTTAGKMHYKDIRHSSRFCVFHLRLL